MKIIRAFGITLLSLTLSLAALNSHAEDKMPAPDFTLKSHSGKNIKLSELRGDVVMINFWASWCGPCLQEMPALEQIHQRYKDLGFTLLGVNVEQDLREAKAYLNKVNVSFPILFDVTNQVSADYEISGMPTTYLVDRDGNLRKLYIGYQPGSSEDTYLREIKALLKE